MKRTIFSLRRTWLLSWAGSAGSAFGAFATLCCFGWTGLATFLPVIGLGFLVRFYVALHVIWIALALTALGSALSFRRHRRPWPLATATLGAGLLLYPMYHALEVDMWLGLVYTGLGLLFISSCLDVWSAGRSCRVARIRKTRAEFPVEEGVKLS